MRLNRNKSEYCLDIITQNIKIWKSMITANIELGINKLGLNEIFQQVFDVWVEWFLGIVISLYQTLKASASIIASGIAKLTLNRNQMSDWCFLIFYLESINELVCWILVIYGYFLRLCSAKETFCSNCCFLGIFQEYLNLFEDLK